MAELITDKHDFLLEMAKASLDSIDWRAQYKDLHKQVQRLRQELEKRRIAYNRQTIELHDAKGDAGVWRTKATFMQSLAEENKKKMDAATTVEQMEGVARHLSSESGRLVAVRAYVACKPGKTPQTKFQACMDSVIPTFEGETLSGLLSVVHACCAAQPTNAANTETLP